MYIFKRHSRQARRCSHLSRLLYLEKAAQMMRSRRRSSSSSSSSGIIITAVVDQILEYIGPLAKQG